MGAAGVAVGAIGVSEGRGGENWLDRALDELRFAPLALWKEEGLVVPSLLTVERGLGSSRMGEGVLSWSGSGEAGSGDPRGVRRGEEVKPRVGADPSAAARVQNKHRCSGSCSQKLERE